MKKPTVSLIVLNYNGKQHLREYFDSVFKQTLLPDEVIMLDNASTDDSVAYVQKNFPKVRVIKNPTNDGTALGSNIAFMESNGDLVIFQSNDLLLDKNCVKYLVDTISQNARIGIVTSILLQYSRYKKDKKLIVDNAGGVMDVYGLGMQKYPEADYQSLQEVEEVSFSYGGSFIIRREIFLSVRGYDGKYFTLNDDIDLSWRVKLLGYNIVFCKNSFVFHKVSATLGTLFNRSIKRYWSERNAMRTLLKNHILRDLFCYFPIYIFLLFGEMGFFLLKCRFDLFWSDMKALLWNIFYLPDTMSLRKYIQENKKINTLSSQLSKKSYKLMLFNSFKNTI